jgi:predicted GIY-YIG superfamily endonuclease
MYCVYWIRHKEHTDCMSQGYIGITKDLQERIRGHRRNKRTTKLNSFLKKYSWENEVEVEILDMNLDLNEALLLEEYYRPLQMIGLNLQKGGELGVDSIWYSNKANSKEHKLATSIGTKEGIKRKDTKEKRRERALKAHKDHPESYVKPVGSKNPKAILNENIVRDIKYILIPDGYTNKAIASLYSVHPRVIQFIRSGKNWKHV